MPFSSVLTHPLCGMRTLLTGGGGLVLTVKWGRQWKNRGRGPETATEPVWLQLHIQSILGELPPALCSASREQISLAWWAASLSSVSMAFPSDCLTRPCVCAYVCVSVCVCACVSLKASLVPIRLTICLNLVQYGSLSTDVWLEWMQISAFNMSVFLHMRVCVCARVSLSLSLSLSP